MSTRPARVAIGGAAATLVLVLAAGPAGAHVTADKSEVPAGGFTALTFTVPHGCEESPTTAIAIQVPEGIEETTPQVHPGWDIAVDAGVVTFTAQAGNELPDGFRDQFTIGFQAPDTPGETQFWKIIQTCEEGEVAWIDEYDGEGEEPEHPAPAVAIVESEGSGHHEEEVATDDTSDTTGTTAGHDEEEVAAEPASSTSDDDGGSDGIAIAGLVVGALGLAAGGTALARSRKATS